MKLGERVQSLRRRHNITQEELGKIIDVSAVSIGGWERGTRYPSAEAIVSLANFFHVSADYLLGVSNNKSDDFLLSRQEGLLLSSYRALDNHGRKVVDTLCAMEKSRVESEAKKSTATNISVIPTRYIPLYSTPSAAGSSVPLDGNDFEMILVDDTVPHDADFAVRIQGESMFPYIHDGDTVYVKKDAELSIGDVGIFCVDGAMYCKQYYVDEERNLILLSANPQLKNTNVFVGTDFVNDVKCYGKVLLDQHLELPDYLHNA